MSTKQNNKSEQALLSGISPAKKIGFAVCAGLLITTLSASVLASHHGHGEGEGKQREARGPIVISEMEQRIDERFNTADVDNSGQLSMAELATIQPAHHKMKRKHKRKNKKDRPNSDEVFSALDADGSGQLSKSEFSSENRHTVRKQLKADKRFAKLDTNNSGTIERSEFGGRLERLRAADTNADGSVNRDEMRAARKANRQQRQNESS